MTASILVVEDDDLIREMIDVILTQAGYQVATAAGAETALDLLKRTRFSLVLMDFHMPGMTGLNIIETLKKRGRVLPPVIMVTANRNIGTVQEAMQLGCAGYLAKPITPEGLLSRVRAALGPAKGRTTVLNA